jgi:acetyl-CoA C-acetyltransferase
MAEQLPRPVAVLGGNRIPFARSNRAYAELDNKALLSGALDGLIDRFDLAGERLGEVVAGAVLKHPRDHGLTREVVLGSRLAPETPAFDLQQACATGIEAAVLVANKIALGQIEVGVAGGVDTTSDAPITLSDRLRKALVKANAARDLRGRLSALAAVRPKDLIPEPPRNVEPRTGLSMGEHTALMAREWGITRAEQDELALESHRKLATAYERGFFNDLLTPFHGLERDENLRPNTSLEALARLKPVFGGPEGTMTAGNSTPLSDGAAVVLLASERWARERGIEPLAYITHAQAAAIDHVGKREGLLIAPVYAIAMLFARTGLTLESFDLFEIHEAFAAQVLATLKALADERFCREKLGRKEPVGTIPREKININGGSLAAGHPFAATGGRLVATLAKELAQRGSGKGLISVCAAGGQGVVAVLER